jgi:hypothetical protein
MRNEFDYFASVKDGCECNTGADPPNFSPVFGHHASTNKDNYDITVSEILAITE